MSTATPPTHRTDVVVIGAGPVGLFTVFELGMLKLSAHVVDALPDVGGQCTALYPEKPIYDIPGFPAINAQDLITNLTAQAAPFSPTYHLGQQVTHLAKNAEGRFDLKTNTGTEINSGAVIIAAGCGAFGPNRPPLDGLSEFEGKHVHYMVTNKDQFAGKTLVIAGGGDSAVDWAVALAPIADKIYMVHRRDKFRAMPESVQKMQELAAQGRIEMVVPFQLKALHGEAGTLAGVEVAALNGDSKLLKADHLLAFFGLAMELGPIANWGLGLTHNHIETNPTTAATNVEGIFAVGDIATYEHKLKLILCGFSESAMAAHAAYKILRPDVPLHFEYSTSKGVQAAA